MQNGTNRYTSSLHSTQLVAKMKLKNPSLQHEKPKWSAYRVIEPKLHPMLLLVTVQVEVSFCRKMNTNHNKKKIYIYITTTTTTTRVTKNTHIFFGESKLNHLSSNQLPPPLRGFSFFCWTLFLQHQTSTNEGLSTMSTAGEFTVDSLTWKGIFVGRWSSGFILFLLIYICIYPPGN